MSIENYTDAIRKQVGDDSRLGATIKFAFNDGGAIFIDGKNVPNQVSNDEAAAADCTVRVSLENFGKLMERKLDPTTAFMTGKIKVEGDMGVAMKLGKVFAG